MYYRTMKNDTQNHEENIVLHDFTMKFLRSAAFADLYKEGIMITEETSDYIQKNAGQPSISNEHALIYAKQTMRLTTRIMQCVGWLLLYRGVAEGEMTLEQARLETNKIPMTQHEKPTDDEKLLLDQELIDLIERSFDLKRKVMRINGQQD